MKSSVKSAVKTALVLGLVAVPTWALAWRAMNGFDVVPIGDNRIEVLSRGNSAAQSFWCAAGHYARGPMRSAATQRIYVSKAVGNSSTSPGRRAVQFSFAPPAGADTSTGFSVSVTRVGDNMNAATAQNYCYDRILF